MTALLLGLNISPIVGADADPIRDALQAEALGFDFVSANDHLHGPAPRYETWTMLSWIAARTSRIRVATRVLATPYRSPPVVAKMAEAFDRLSGGRLILGLGAGALDEEFHAFGLPDRSPGERIDGLEEAVRIIRGIWSEPSFTFPGELYRTDRAEMEPKPEHRIPIWLGMHGNRGLALTGRLADGWIPSLELAPPERIPAMRERILGAARAVGRDPGNISCVYNLEVRVDERSEGERSEAEGSQLHGPAEAIVGRLLGFLPLGLTGFNFVPIGPDEHEQVERLGRDVIPALRASA